uniref:Phospholipid-transporting ATPase n=1 Tax=Noccaea caerulescens TaxID=107243 RepID=A0A1J3JQ60_NOCCA
MAGERRKGMRFSKLYSFKCLKPFSREDRSQIGSRGYSRVVFCNDPDNPEALQLNYKGNYVSTTKYTAANFIPKSLFEQFRRVANIYFLVVAFVSFSPLAPYTAPSVLAPLLIVIGATMVKEGVEDWRRRKQDIEANNRKVEVCGKNGTFSETKWKNLRVGDLVKVHKDEYFPADLLLLSSSFEDGICYVETMNLDGETNLKLKHALEITSDEESIKNFRGLIKCEDPNEHLYSFVGTLHFQGKQYPLSPQQILLRDSKLKNTDYVYGVVVFTGHDTKVMQNATDPPSKRSKIEKKMDKIIYILFTILIMIAFTGSVFFGIMTRRDLLSDDGNGKLNRWYLRPDQTTIFYDPRRALLAAFFHFLTALMLYGYLIPISLYVSIEVVKVLQSIFINQDQEMYHEETDRPARARTSNLNEELGQVDTILSDKTGTLTCNSMEFVKCSIAGTAYGRGMTEVEMALRKQKGMMIPQEEEVLDDSLSIKEMKANSTTKSVKGFNFWDERIVDGKWVNQPNAELIQKFFRVLAICHTAIPDVNSDTGEITYEAESPDEAAFVIASRELGFEFFERSQTCISLHEIDHMTGEKVDRVYELLHVLEFSSSRKRMSVIVRNPESRLLLLSKGADSVMFERLAKHGRQNERETKEHIKRYAEAGLRTLVITYREVDEEEYRIWEEEFLRAKTLVTEDRDALIDAAADKIEKDLILLGSTAVEDKLQKGVPDCIDKLSQAGVKIWVLTGDKTETAINIGYACSLLREGMQKILITLDSPEIEALEKQGDKGAVAKASFQSIKKQLREGMSQTAAATDNSANENPEMFGLVIDGNSLTYALDKNLEKEFLELASRCSSVICCRSSPKQKALVTRLVKSGTGRTTLAIGDGANDVGMLQEADIGVGISGVEGMQAVMSSDIAIAQFRYLERLLLVHGHWCYRRISKMICYFFYKNITFGFTLFLYEAYTSFSATPAYNDWYLSLYSVLFSSLPVICLGIFDQDVSAQFCLKFPVLYQEGVQNLLFSWRRILSWMFHGFCSAIIIFFLCKTSLESQAFNHEGKPAGRDIIGGTMYTCVVWVVSLQMVLTISYFTVVQHVVVWGSVVVWYLFLMVYGSLPIRVSTDAYMVFVEALAPAPAYWITTLFVVLSTMTPYFIFSAIQMQFFPMSHGTIKLLKYEDQCNDPVELEMVRQASVRPALVGFTARIEAIKRSVMRSHMPQP